MRPPGKTHAVRLCTTLVRTVNVPGRYGDGYGGLGLSLRVTPRKGGGSWVSLNLGRLLISQIPLPFPRPPLYRCTWRAFGRRR